MSLQHAAKYLASHGRDGDTMLVHMNPKEVGSLQALAKANGGSLSVNPNTGLPEASFLSGLLPAVIGGGLMAMSGGAINPMTAGLLVGGLQTARTGSLQKGLMAGFGAYGGAGLASGLANAGASSLAAESAGAAFDPTTMATAGQGATSGITPNVMTMEQLTAAHPEATMAELDTAQQAQTAARNAALEQQTAANVLKPQQLGQTIEQIKTTTPMIDQLRAGLGSATASPTAGLNFLGDNSRAAFSAAAPIAAGISTGAAPNVPTSGPNPYKYQYEANVSSPFPTPDVPGYGDQGRNFGREQRFFGGRYVPAMAGGGPVEAMSNANAMGANTGYPMANIRHGAYATPYQQPISQNVVTGDQDTRVDPYTGEERLAGGGITGSGELNLNIPLDFGGGAVGGFGQGPNSTGLNVNQGPLDLGQGNNSGFGQANANGYKAAGSGTPFSSSLTGSPNTVGLSQNPFSMLLPGGYNLPAGYSPEQAQSGMSFEEMVKRQQGLDAQRTTPQIMQERLAQQTIREAKAAEDAKKYTRDFSSFGFDKKLLDYLNNQRAASTYDGGIDYAYDPVTQTFRGGARGGPVTKTLDEMQAYANKGMASGGLAALAAGGMYNLGGYSDGGRLLRGPGDGVSDSIPATIGNKQPARLADGEFVVPARIVSELGNGSTEAGARKLYAMMDRVQKARGRTTGKGKIAKNTRADKFLPA